MENLEAILYVCVKDLEIQLQLNDVEVEQLETALQEKGFNASFVTRIPEYSKR